MFSTWCREEVSHTGASTAPTAPRTSPMCHSPRPLSGNSDSLGSAAPSEREAVQDSGRRLFSPGQLGCHVQHGGDVHRKPDRSDSGTRREVLPPTLISTGLCSVGAQFDSNYQAYFIDCDAQAPNIVFTIGGNQYIVRPLNTSFRFL